MRHSGPLPEPDPSPYRQGDVMSHACRVSGCRYKAAYMVSVPSYQLNTCARHLASTCHEVANEWYGPSHVQVTFLSEAETDD